MKTVYTTLGMTFNKKNLTVQANPIFVENYHAFRACVEVSTHFIYKKENVCSMFKAIQLFSPVEISKMFSEKCLTVDRKCSSHYFPTVTLFIYFETLVSTLVKVRFVESFNILSFCNWSRFSYLPSKLRVVTLLSLTEDIFSLILQYAVQQH